MQDQQAIARLKQGEIKALEELVSRYQVEAVQAAYLIVGDRPTAEDVVQTAYLKAFERIHQFKDGLPFRPWFLRIVKNDALKAASKARRKVSVEAMQEAGAAAAWLIDAHPGPEQLADSAETRQQIWEALSQLPPKQRASIVMRYFLGLKGREISTRQQRSVGAVKWSLHAARERLRAILGRHPEIRQPVPADETTDREAGGE